MIRRLRIKFVCINMAIVTAMLYVIFSLIIFFMGMGLEIQSQNMMQQLMDSSIRPEWRGEGRQEVRRPYFLVQIDHRGDTVNIDRSYFDQTEDSVLEEYIHAALDAGEVSGTLKEDKLRFRKHNSPMGMTIVFVDISAEIAAMENLVKACVVIGLASFGIFFGISFLLAKWAVKPVETVWNQQKQFVADASHELKTPLTVIMTNAEMLQEPEYSETERQRFAGSILIMSRQMRGLVESLLELARVDNGTARMDFAEVNFSELTAEGLLPFEPLYFEKELLLESNIEEGLKVKGSAAHLRQVLDILLDNGAKYSAPGTQVSVQLRRQAAACLLTVSNSGEPISREDLTNIFKRFYRVDKARSMNHSYGLGLSIADSIVKEHGGKIWAESSGGVNTFLVQLPLS